MSGPHLGSTYRLQLHGLGFRHALSLLPYLADLGIETVYLSPVWAAVPGSTHGYDVVDPTRLDPSLGTADDFEELLAALLARGMRALLDIVPNHMAVHRSNTWWWDVLREGRTSDAADTFDIDWSRHGGRVLVPTLNQPLADLVAAGAVTVDERAQELDVDGQLFPAAVGTRPGSAWSMLTAQHYRPAYWRSSATEGNYRRFFDIGSLVGVRVEDPGVFTRTHERVPTLCQHPAVAGVRVDHVDGLVDPAQYLGRLRARLGNVVILVEKILASDESLDPRWPVDGTTGYEFADRALALLVDPSGSARLLALGVALTGTEDTRLSAASVRAKREVLEESFAGDLDRLTRLSRAALDDQIPGHDLARRDVRRAWADLTVHLDAYRTYLDGRGETSAADRDRIEGAVRRASGPSNGRICGRDTARALTVLAGKLLSEADHGGPWLEVVRRWQQLSAAVMAKGLEDTATYRYAGLAARVDVGSDPDAASSPDSFHRFAAGRLQGLNATSTHDSKRNEDARSRLAVLSEVADEWSSLVRGWHERFRGTRGSSAPDPLDELRVYETLFVLWPSESSLCAVDERGQLRTRAKGYLRKAAREAKLHTSWTEADEAYEERVTTFVDLVCADPEFRQALTCFSESVAASVLCNTLALVVLKACCPGTPDFYQGSEFLEPTVTDPDNRRPVDFGTRATALSRLPDPAADAAAALLAAGTSGPLKLYVTRQLLRERTRSPDLFDRGSYLPLATTTEHALAFARSFGPEYLIAVVPRLTHGRAPGNGPPLGAMAWGDTEIELPVDRHGVFRDVFTGRRVAASSGSLGIGSVLGILPVSVLRAEPG